MTVLQVLKICSRSSGTEIKIWYLQGWEFDSLQHVCTSFSCSCQ